MIDLTVIYYTANCLNEKFASRVRKQLLTAAGDAPIISVSKKPIDFGINIIDLEKERSVANIYKAVLLGAQAAKTKYVALAEDDALYPPEHFYTSLPPDDTFLYNFCRWNIFSWSNPPFFSLTPRKILATLIAPRQLLIDSIQERFTKYPDVSQIPERWMGEPGRADYEIHLGVTPRKADAYYSYVPTIVFSHPEALGYLIQGTKKRANRVRAIELPYWGTAQNVLDNYYL